MRGTTFSFGLFFVSEQSRTLAFAASSKVKISWVIDFAANRNKNTIEAVLGMFVYNHFFPLSRNERVRYSGGQTTIFFLQSLEGVSFDDFQILFIVLDHKTQCKQMGEKIIWRQWTQVVVLAQEMVVVCCGEWFSSTAMIHRCRQRISMLRSFSYRF